MGNTKSKNKGASTYVNTDEEFGGFNEMPRLYEFERFMNLGKGSFGTVEGCLYRGHPLAIKKIPKSRLFRRTDHSGLAWTERNAMITMNGTPMICPILCTVQSIDEIFMIMPFYNGGDLRSLLKSSGRMSTTAVIFYLAEILVGLEHLHKRNICHRDIKPDNVFIDSDGHIVIGDFGLAIKVNENLMHPTHYWGKCGSYGYRAPEVVFDLVCGTFSDVYSLGVTVYYLLFGGVPFRETKVRLEGKPLRFPDIRVPNALLDLLTRMMELEPSDRATIPQIKNHPVFQGLDWEAVAKKEYEPHWVPSPIKYLDKMAELEQQNPLPPLHDNKVQMNGGGFDWLADPGLSSEQQKRFLGFDWLPGMPSRTQKESTSTCEYKAQQKEEYSTPFGKERQTGVARSPVPPTHRTLKDDIGPSARSNRAHTPNMARGLRTLQGANNLQYQATPPGGRRGSRRSSELSSPTRSGEKRNSQGESLRNFAPKGRDLL